MLLIQSVGALFQAPPMGADLLVIEARRAKVQDSRGLHDFVNNDGARPFGTFS